jgi:predicted O-linked N-acetylglucosamine transferase (SPINDLY family)
MKNRFKNIPQPKVAAKAALHQGHSTLQQGLALHQRGHLAQAQAVYEELDSNYKIIPATFDGWMRILDRVPGSVLWLFGGTPTATINLRKEARARGIGDDRLIFAERRPLPEHLARHSAADLFLDTLPCNAHTTASDALWAGLPVLTCMGESFASRVAASLLNAIHLPELITQTQADYEALAIELATNSEKLSVIKEKLAANRLTAPLFDTPLFTKHIEAAYKQIYHPTMFILNRSERVGFV